MLENFSLTIFKDVSLCILFSFVMLAHGLLPLFSEWVKFNHMSKNAKSGFYFSVLLSILIFGYVFYLASQSELLYPNWAISFTIIILDFASYFWHFAGHRMVFLWKIHHKQHDLPTNVKGKLNVHPLETFFPMGFRLILVWLMRLPVEGLLLFEVISLILKLSEKNKFEYSPWLDSILNKVFMTKSLCKIHSNFSENKQVRNFGTILSVWDRLFGTHLDSKDIQASELLSSRLIK